MTIKKHIKNLKAIALYMPSDKCSDWIESLMAGIDAMEELQAYRKAWENIDIEIKNKTREQYDDDFKRGMRLGFEEALDIIRDCKPKEGDANDY